MAVRYFYEHPQLWLTPIDVALSLYVEVFLCLVEAVKTVLFPDSVDTLGLLKDQKACLRNFLQLLVRLTLH